MKNGKNRILGIALLAAALLMFVGQQLGFWPTEDSLRAQNSLAAVNEAIAVPTEHADESAADKPIITPQAIADYLFAHGKLPDNFITKKEAEALGWDSSVNYVSDVAPDKSIGGDHFGNYEGVLPETKGVSYHECDINYTGGRRTSNRLVYSSDGHVYVTYDHYASFKELFPSGS